MAVVPESVVMFHRPSVEIGAADFKKKPRYPIVEHKDIRRNCSEEKTIEKGIGHHQEQIINMVSPSLANKVPLVKAQKSPQLGGAALAPTPKEQQRKQHIKPQSAVSNNQKLKVDLKPLARKEEPPASKKELNKEAPPKIQKEHTKKIAKKKERPM